MRVKVRTDRAITELCRSRLQSLYRTLHKKDRTVSLIRDMVENTEAFIRKVQESDSVLNNTIEPYPDLNYVQQLKKFAVSYYWTGSEKEADMMFWAVLIFVLLAFCDLYLPDFTKPAKESMIQYMICALLPLVVILKLAQAASQPGESWRQFKNLIGLPGSANDSEMPKNGSKTAFFENKLNSPKLIAWGKGAGSWPGY